MWVTGLVTAALILSGIHAIVSAYNGCSLHPSVRLSILPHGQTLNLAFQRLSEKAPATRRLSIHSPLPNAITRQPRNNPLPA